MVVTKIEPQVLARRKRVAAYCRVSTDKDAQLESLDNQMEAFRYRLAFHKDWELVNIYTDEGITGTQVKNRTAFLRMISDCENGLIDYIITKSISRFARNTLDCINYVRHLQSIGVNVYFEKEGIDTGESASEMILTIMASFAQEESRSISENIKWGKRKRFEEGKEAKVPIYGYYHTKDEGYIVNREEAKIVNEIFLRYAHGETRRSITDDLNARCIKPAVSERWNHWQIDKMLKNERYIGDAVLQKSYTENHLTHKIIRNSGELPKFYVKDAHEAIIDRHLFEQVQKILSMKNVKKGNISYPYGEMLRCPYCGSILVHGSLNDFSCENKRIHNGGWGCYGKGGCRNYLVIQDYLDNAVIKAYAKEYGQKMKSVEFYWLDDSVERINAGESSVSIVWRNGEKTEEKMEFPKEKFSPVPYSRFYNFYLERVKSGDRKNKNRFLMGMEEQ